jgi:enamine deaminase RidA (YjgF/YER057c/UK114 family)
VIYNTVDDGPLVTKKKIPVKLVTEATLKKEIARLDKSIGHALVLLKGMSAEVKSTSKATKLADLEKQIAALQKQVAETAKKAVKKPRKLSEMNIFVKEQIKSGKSFSEAIQAWKDFKLSRGTPSSEISEKSSSGT